VNDEANYNYPQKLDNWFTIILLFCLACGSEILAQELEPRLLSSFALEEIYGASFDLAPLEDGNRFVIAFLTRPEQDPGAWRIGYSVYDRFDSTSVGSLYFDNGWAGSPAVCSLPDSGYLIAFPRRLEPPHETFAKIDGHRFDKNLLMVGGAERLDIAFGDYKDVELVRLKAVNISPSLNKGIITWIQDMPVGDNDNVFGRTFNFSKTPVSGAIIFPRGGAITIPHPFHIPALM
jgi:hypothetical protein